MNKPLTGLGIVQEKIIDEDFVSAHKSRSDDFTRNRKLSFQIIFMKIFRKTVKSLQRSLNELFMNSHLSTPVSASAYTQARNKFRHTAFIELNNDIVDIFYSEDEGIKKWNGYR